MTRNEKGFSLIEILIAVAVLGIVMALSSQLLEHMVIGQKKQAVITTNQFEMSLGLEMLRNDVSNAGYGLADEFKGTPSIYTEASTSPAMQFNNTPNVPKALQHANTVTSAGYIENSDYLIIRSPAVGMGSAAGKWTNITSTKVHFWNDINLDMTTNDYMIVVKPRVTSGGNSQLIVSGGVYAIKYPGQTADLDTGFQPNTGEGERFLAFGMGTAAPTMPFNRADYYVKQPAPANPNCAPGTGTFYKEVIGDAVYPLIECVANMQVVFNLDTNLDGVPELLVNDISGLDPYKIKEQVKEVHIYILAHEGLKDASYKSELASAAATVGPSTSLGTTVNLNTLDTTATDAWKQYRWNSYKLVVKPKSFY
ncbi:MAG: hypothetical protein H6Q52_789 [Deltaproteobacteria bacterium]|nr:hypothetical protein [Deltaproteobacteria bacterium]